MRRPLFASAAFLLLAPFSAAAQDARDLWGPHNYDGLHVDLSVGDGDFDLHQFTSGLYSDFDNYNRYTSYLGGGLGSIYVDSDNVTVAGVTYGSNDDTYFTTDSEVRITDDFALVPAYRFFWTDDSGDVLKDDTANVLKLGVRARF